MQKCSGIFANSRSSIPRPLPSPTPKPEGGLANDHFWTEAALFETNLDWTILRHNIYTDGIAMRLPRIAESGQFHSATNGGGRSYVTRADCARWS